MHGIKDCRQSKNIQWFDCLKRCVKVFIDYVKSQFAISPLVLSDLFSR